MYMIVIETGLSVYGNIGCNEVLESSRVNIKEDISSKQERQQRVLLCSHRPPEEKVECPHDQAAQTPRFPAVSLRTLGN